MRHFAAVILGVMALASSFGCATIVNGTDQPIQFSTLNGSADGTVSFSNGSTSGETHLPGIGNLERSNNDLVLIFRVTKNNGEKVSYSQTIPSTETGWMAGNAGIAVLTLGVGVIGAVVDGITNASREYPIKTVLDTETGRLILEYEDDKKHYLYTDHKFIECNTSGNPVAGGVVKEVGTQKPGGEPKTTPANTPKPVGS